MAQDTLKVAGGGTAGVEFQHQQSLMQQASAFASAEATQDAQTDAKSANILGYTDEIFRTPSNDPKMATLKDEIESDRYYVVLLAYDFVAARKFGQHNLCGKPASAFRSAATTLKKPFRLWRQSRASTFGQDSHGLIHHNLGEGQVEVGEPKSLGTSP